MNIPLSKKFKPCGKCNKGYVFRGEMAVYCDCLREYEKKDSIRRMAGYTNLPLDYLDCEINNFEVLSNAAVNFDSFTKVKQFVSRLDYHLEEGHGLVLMGNNNCGKTHIATAIQKLTFSKYTSHFILAASYINLITKSWATKDIEDIDDIDNIRTVELLVLDDLDKAVLSAAPFKKEVLDELLRTRISNRRSTIITTNLPTEDAIKGFLEYHMFSLLKRKSYFLTFEGEYTDTIVNNLDKDLT